ncbi:MAG TPA: hypothetical protein VF843_17475 [Streptosporangiaceae bacterium]
MNYQGGALQRPGQPGPADPADPSGLAAGPDGQPGLEEWADLRAVVGWLRANKVVVAGLVLIVIELAWKAQFLGHLYFRQDDFHDLDLAIQSPLSWRYVTFIGAGHLIIGLRVVAWFLVRAGLYDWGLASVISLALVGAASLAALRLLRLLFGSRPAILIPLALYLFSPLTLPDLGEWSSALESVPLQLALFMAVHAHVRYCRTGRTLPLAAAAAWIAFGLLFFEKGLGIPVLLFGLTGGFLITDRSSWLGGLVSALTRYWRAWALYAVIMVAYLVLLVQSLHTSTTKPAPPASSAAVITFAGGLMRNSLLPGVVGGPWQWLPVAGNSYSFAAPPYSLSVVALAAAVVVVAISIWRRPVAWRAWTLLLAWVLVADMLPVIISRLGAFSPAVLGTETRYVADAVPVLAICVGLAFWPLTRQAAAGGEVAAAARPGGQDEPMAGHRWPAAEPGRPATERTREGAAVLVALVLFGSIWSVQAYENTTTGQPAAQYIANAAAGVRLVPRGTTVMNEAVPGTMVEGLFGPFSMQSTVIGDIATGKLIWTRHPTGTVDGLRIVGSDGRFYQAHVVGAVSLPLPAGRTCWAARHGRITIRLNQATPSYTGIVRIGYLWLAQDPGTVQVRAGNGRHQLVVRQGLHSAFLPASGSFATIVIRELSGPGLCVGDVQAGNLGPDSAGQTLPAKQQ